MSDTTEYTALFESYLSALCDPDGGARLHALLAPAAIVPVGTTLQRADRADPVEFARTHAQRSRQGEAVLPIYQDARPVEGATAAEGAHVVAWFDLLEQRHARRILVVAGFESTSGGLRVGWCRTAARVEPCGYAQGYLRTLADLAWMGSELPARPRSLLDAGYFRAHPPRTEVFAALDDARFSCHMSTVCCRLDFEITLDPSAQLLIDAIDWTQIEPRLVATRLPERTDGRLQLKRHNEACRFVGAQGQCLVHQVVGMQPFSICAIYPFTFARTPEAVAVAVSTVCPSARHGRGLPLLHNGADIQDRFAQAQPRQTDVYRLSPDEATSWDRFRDVERALLACLATSELPLRQRLLLGTRILGAVREGGPLRTAEWLAEPAPGITPELRAALQGMLARILAWDRPVLRQLPQRLPGELSARECAQPEVLTRVLQNMLYSKSYSYDYDLTTAYGFVILLYLLALVMQGPDGGPPLTDAQWQELGALGVHGLLKDVLHEGVPEGFRALMGTVEFGQWLLAV